MFISFSNWGLLSVSTLHCMLIHLHKPRTELVLCGDTNVNFLINNNHKMELTLLLQIYNMFYIIDFPARINETSGSATDGIFIDG
jgi:hypothetical protein